MKHKKQTSVDWLYYKIVIQNSDCLKWRQYLEQAIEMHKDEVKSIYKPTILQNEDGNFYTKGFEQYYNETFEKDGNK